MNAALAKRLSAFARDFDPLQPVEGMANVFGLGITHIARFECSTALDDVDAIIALTDDVASDCDLECTGDVEPSLGWPSSGIMALKYFANNLEPFADDLEADNCDLEETGDCEEGGDNEPGIVYPHVDDQQHWLAV
jgi:hypothetical protein